VTSPQERADTLLDALVHTRHERDEARRQLGQQATAIGQLQDERGDLRAERDRTLEQVDAMARANHETTSKLIEQRDRAREGRETFLRSSVALETELGAVKAELANVTAERDEAREHLERERDEAWFHLKHQRDELRSHLRASDKAWREAVAECEALRRQLANDFDTVVDHEPDTVRRAADEYVTKIDELSGQLEAALRQRDAAVAIITSLRGALVNTVTTLDTLDLNTGQESS
jgi:chromosome segregation ATPase